MVAFLSFVVCLAISGGLGYSAYQRSKRREMRAATRLAALALVPVGLDLAGFVRLGRKVGDAIGHWAIHLVFDPLVWIGIVMLGLAALLWIVTGFRQPRRVRRAGRRHRSPAARRRPEPAEDRARQPPPARTPRSRRSCASTGCPEVR